MADANRAIQLQLFLTGEKPTVKGLDNVNKASNRAASGVGKVGGAAGSTAKKIPPLTSSMKGTTGAVINFNRVIQDAPFGLIGVANNIDPLIISFKDLKAQTGSTARAMGTLLKGAFLGPLGLVTIMSIVTSALLAFGPKLKNAFSGKNTEKIKEMKSEVESLKDEFNGLVDSVELSAIRLQLFAKYGRAATTEEEKLALLTNQHADATRTLYEALDQAYGTQIRYRMETFGETYQEARDKALELVLATNEHIRTLHDSYVYTGNLIGQQKKHMAQSERYNELTKDETKELKDLNDELQRQAELRTEQEWKTVQALQNIGAAIDAHYANLKAKETAYNEWEQGEQDRLEAAEAARRARRDAEDDQFVANLKRKAKAEEEWRENIARSGAAYIQNAIIHKKSADQIIKDINRMIARQLIFMLLKKGLSALVGGGTGTFGKAAGFLGFEPPQARQGVQNFSGGPLQVHKDELIWAPPGTNVLSQSASRQVMRDGGGTQQVAVYLNGDLANLVDAIEVLSDRNVRSGVGPSLRNR